jgi:3-deoxy-D-manno-octulosonate 8-phosphate phosphatase (KDO 8-P phosphatase)
MRASFLFTKIKYIFNFFIFYKKKFKKLILVFDVDGVFTDGKFTYSNSGKVLKTFGSWDSDELKTIGKSADLIYISADPSGFEISQKRILDIGGQLQFVTAIERKNFILELKTTGLVVFTADAKSDAQALAAADISFTPANAHPEAKINSSFILRRNGGEGAVAEVIETIKKLKII